jgi:hypothetical protein
MFADDLRDKRRRPSIVGGLDPSDTQDVRRNVAVDREACAPEYDDDFLADSINADFRVSLTGRLIEGFAAIPKIHCLAARG